MRILIFTTAYFPQVGGAEVAVKEITERISDVDFDLITIRYDKNGRVQEKIGNVNVLRIGGGYGKLDKLLYPFHAARFAKKLNEQHEYNIVWSIMASYSGFAALFFKKKHPDVKFLLTLQEGDDLSAVEKKASFPFIKRWFKEIFTRADYIQCISNYLADWAREMGERCPVEVVPNGVNIKDFQFPITNDHSISNDQFSKLKKELSIDKDEKIILTTSRLVKKNGIADLIQAIQLLITNYELRIKLIICGNGELENELKQLAKDLKIENRVKFAGFVKPEELPNYYGMADVFCRPSLTEGLGNSFLEAMAYNLPVVATRVGGIKDFLEDGQTGFVCEVSNPDSIAEKIAHILDEKNIEEVERVKITARQMVEEKYNWDIIGEKMKAIFNKMAKNEKNI